MDAILADKTFITSQIRRKNRADRSVWPTHDVITSLGAPMASAGSRSGLEAKAQVSILLLVLDADLYKEMPAEPFNHRRRGP